MDLLCSNLHQFNHFWYNIVINFMFCFLTASACIKSRCMNGAKCVDDHKHFNYTCKCAGDFQGQYCDIRTSHWRDGMFNACISPMSVHLCPSFNGACMEYEVCTILPVDFKGCTTLHLCYLHISIGAECYGISFLYLLAACVCLILTRTLSEEKAEERIEEHLTSYTPMQLGFIATVRLAKTISNSFFCYWMLHASILPVFSKPWIKCPSDNEEYCLHTWTSSASSIFVALLTGI